MKAEICIWYSEGVCLCICHIGKSEESRVRFTRGTKLGACGNRPEALCPPHTLHSAPSAKGPKGWLCLLRLEDAERSKKFFTCCRGWRERENHKTIFKQLFSGEAGRHRRRKRFVWKITAKDDSWADSDKLPGNLHLAVLGLCQPIIPHTQQEELSIFRGLHFLAL